MNYEHTVLKELDKHLRENRQIKIDTLAIGNLASFEDYKKECGYIHATNDAINLIADITKEIDKK